MRAMTKMAAPRLTILTKLATLAIFCQFRQISSSKGNDITWVNIGDFGEFVQPLVAKLSFSPCLPNSPTFMGPFTASLLCALPRWRLWQNCHFRQICLIRLPLWAPSLLHCFVLCLAGDCGKIVIFALFAKFAFFYGPPHCFIALCFASLAIVAKVSFSPYLPNLPTFMGPLIASLLCALPRWRLWQNCHFRHICQICLIRLLLWAPSLLHCFVLCLAGDCGKIVIFAIFAKFANFYGSPSLLRALPRWRFWQNCHFRHICQICQHF